MSDKKRTARLDWEDVRYFVELARNGTLSRNRAEMRVSHATVARPDCEPGNAAWAPLFDRRIKGYVLTAEGKAVFGGRVSWTRLRSVLRRLDAGTELSGSVRLAVGRVLAERFLIDRLRAFHERYPAIDWKSSAGLGSCLYQA